MHVTWMVCMLDPRCLTLQTSMAGVSLVSLVSFLKAKPMMAMLLPEMVLNMASIMRPTNLRFW